MSNRWSLFKRSSAVWTGSLYLPTEIPTLAWSGNSIPDIKSSLLIIKKFNTNIGMGGSSSSGVGEALAHKLYSPFNLNFEYKQYIAKVQNAVMHVTLGAVVKSKCEGTNGTSNCKGNTAFLHTGWYLACVLSLDLSHLPQVLNSSLKIHMELIHYILTANQQDKGTED